MTNRVVLSSPQGVTCGYVGLTSGYVYRFSASQAEYAGSIPVIGSTIYRLSPANTQNITTANPGTVAPAVANALPAAAITESVARSCGYSAATAVARTEIRCRGQPGRSVMTPSSTTSPLSPHSSEGNTMIRTIVTAIAASALVLLGAGIATADVISQTTSEESHQKTSNTGTSNEAADHMANDGPGIVNATSPGHVLVAKLVPVLDEDGNPVLNANGNPTYDVKNVWVRVGSGPAPATIVHN